VSEGRGYANKTIFDKISVYIPLDRLEQKPVERLKKI